MRKRKSTEPDRASQSPYRVRLPGFITNQDIGLGDVIKRTAYAVGVKPCANCEKRAARLNRWMIFTR